MFELIDKRIEAIDLKVKLKKGNTGAFFLFEGLVRSDNYGKRVKFLEIEAEDKLCQNEYKNIIKEIKQNFKIIDLRSIHRVGRIKPGETIIKIAVTSEHRKDAFNACQYLIEELKHRLPIWKKEYYTDGTNEWLMIKDSPTQLSIEEQDYNDRQVKIPQIGQAGQKKLKSSKVLVVGAGGLGSAALMSLASLGVGVIGICEYDKVDITNLHRQHLYGFNDLGRAKIDVAQRRIMEINKFCQVKKYAQQINKRNALKIIKDFDIILDCTDTMESKLLLNDLAIKYKKILIQASVYQFEGQLRTYFPKQKGCLRCLWNNLSQAKALKKPRESGVISVVPNILGHCQALEALKVILNLDGQLKNQMLLINLINYDVKKINNYYDKKCKFC